MREEILRPRGVSASLERQRPQGREWGTRWMVLDFRESGADIPNALNSSDEITCYLSQNWVGGGVGWQKGPTKEVLENFISVLRLVLQFIWTQESFEVRSAEVGTEFFISKIYSKAISSSDINPILEKHNVFGCE